MQLKIKHEVFDDLTYDYGWIENIELELFGVRKTLQIIIDADEEAYFETAQVQAYNEFFNDFEETVRHAEIAVFNFYQKESPEIRAQYGNDLDINKYVPYIERKEEFYKLVSPEQIIFPATFDKSKQIAGFLCECSWEMEHGLGIKFENGEVVEVGFQDILL